MLASNIDFALSTILTLMALDYLTFVSIIYKIA